jgi:hypothetical protein
MRAAFNFSHNIVYWRQGPLLGGGTSLFVSAFDRNLYFDASGGDAAAALRDTGFPCPQAFGPVDPASTNGIVYNGQSLFAPKVLLSAGKRAWVAIDVATGSLCVGASTQPVAAAVWCSPPASPEHGAHADRMIV